MALLRRTAAESYEYFDAVVASRRAQHPERRQALAADPALIPNAV